MSQEEFAQYFHVTRQTISNWEKEKSFPDLQTLVKISDAAGVSVDAMLRDNFEIVQQIDKKLRHLKLFKMGTAIIAAIVLAGISYIGIQSVKQDNIIHTMGKSLKELGFEKSGNNYSSVRNGKYRSNNAENKGIYDIDYLKRRLYGRRKFSSNHRIYA